jgi:hypothetical protein
MTEDILILNLRGKGLEEIHIEQGQFPPLTRQWLDNILIQNGGKIFKYSEKIKIGVGSAFGSCVRVWVSNGREFMMAYCTDDVEFFLNRFDKIIEAVTSPHYFIVVKKTEMFYANGTINIPQPIIEYPFIEGVCTKDIHKN